MRGFLASVTAVALAIPATIAAGGPWLAPAILLLAIWIWNFTGSGKPRLRSSWLAMASLNWAGFYLAFLAATWGLDRDIARVSRVLTLAGIPIFLVVSFAAYHVYQTRHRQRAGVTG